MSEQCNATVPLPHLNLLDNLNDQGVLWGEQKQTVFNQQQGKNAQKLAFLLFYLNIILVLARERGRELVLSG